MCTSVQARLRARGSPRHTSAPGPCAPPPDLSVCARSISCSSDAVATVNSNTPTWSFQDSDGLPRQTPHDLPRPLCIPHPIPPRSSIPPLHPPVPGPYHLVLLRLRIRRIPHQRHPFVHLDHIPIQRCGPLNPQLEYLWPGLIPDQQNVSKTTGDDQRMAVTFALEQRVGRDGRRQSNVVCTRVSFRCEGCFGVVFSSG